MTKHKLKNKLPAINNHGDSDAVHGNHCPSTPCGPHHANTPMAATNVGTTKGSIKVCNNHPRPAKRQRAITHATGTPKLTAKKVVTPACVRDHTMRPRR